MEGQTLKGRSQQKRATEANWLKATNFVPLAGEIIIYEVDDTHDTPRLKVGDGTTLVNSLPFVSGDGMKEVMSADQPTGLSAGDSWLKLL